MEEKTEEMACRKPQKGDEVQYGQTIVGEAFDIQTFKEQGEGIGERGMKDYLGPVSERECEP